MKKITALIVFVLTFTLTGTLQAAQRSAEERREAYGRGLAALDSKSWDDALRIFKELWDEQHTYDIALGLGEAEFRLKRYREAAEHLTFALQNIPPHEKLDISQNTTKTLERVKQQVGALTLIVDQPGASIQIDGRPVGVTPLPSLLFVDPGHHLIEATLSRYQPAKTEIDIDRGQAKAVTMQLEAAPSQPPPTTDPERAPNASTSPADKPHATSNKGRTITLIAGGALTAIALTTTIVFKVKSSSAESDANDLRATIDESGPNACAEPQPIAACSELKQRQNDRNAANRVVNIALPITLVAAAGTAIAYLVWPEPHRTTAHAIVTPVFGRNTGGLLLTGRF
jgi:hypothetical protein